MEKALNEPMFAFDAKMSALNTLTERFLIEANDLIVSAVTKDLNQHQLIHLQEIIRNCLSSLIVFYDAVLSNTGGDHENDIILTLHPDLCGLLRSVDCFSDYSGHQQRRIPYSPSRVGHEVTYEELANLFRTSRVNLRRLEHDVCYRKMRIGLRKYKDTAQP